MSGAGRRALFVGRRTQVPALAGASHALPERGAIQPIPLGPACPASAPLC